MKLTWTYICTAISNHRNIISRTIEIERMEWCCRMVGVSEERLADLKKAAGRVAEHSLTENYFTVVMRMLKEEWNDALAQK